ncbi:MAG: hypothetical protein M1833_004395 [Piccolia ochrophora]|nr:MAG: hypothetical protein M1833_004395 [Piccolia ochrophora]
MSNQGYYGQPQYPQYPQQSYGPPQGGYNNYGPPPPMQYQQPPPHHSHHSQRPQGQYVERRKKDRSCLGAW